MSKHDLSRRDFLKVSAGLGLTASLAAGLAACAGQPPAAAPAATQVPAAPAATQVPAAAAATEKTVLVNGVPFKVPVGKDKSKIEIPVVYMNITTPFAQSIKQGVDAAAKEFGVNGYMTGPTDWSTEAQIAVIENLLAKNVDGISIAILDIPGLTPMVQKSIEKQIPVTCFNVDAPESGRLSFVGEDLFKAGEEVGNALVEYMGENGTVLISTEAIDAIWSQKREAGTRAALAKYPGIKVLPTLNCTSDQQKSYATLENALLANPDVTGHCSCGGTCFVFSKLLKDKNIGNRDSAKPIWNTGHDLREEKVIQIQEGWSTAQFGQNPYKQGYEAVKQLAQFLTTGEPGSFQEIDTGVFRVDEKNADEVLKRIEAGEPIG